MITYRYILKYCLVIPITIYSKIYLKLCKIHVKAMTMIVE